MRTGDAGRGLVFQSGYNPCLTPEPGTEPLCAPLLGAHGCHLFLKHGSREFELQGAVQPGSFWDFPPPFQL